MTLKRFRWLCCAALWLACATAAGEDARPGRANAASPVLERLRRTFETGGAPWTIANTSNAAARTLAANAGESWDCREIGGLSISAQRSAESRGQPGAAVRLRWVVNSRVGGLYLGPSVTLPLTGALDVRAGFSGETGELTPLGHQRPWDNLCAADVISIELRAECTFGAGARPVNVLLQAFTMRAVPAARVQPSLLDVHLETPPGGSRAEAVLCFRIHPPPADPYAVSGEGDVRVKLPDGRQALAFLDQDYVAKNDGSAVRLVESGLPCWRAYIPVDVYPREGLLTVRSGSNEWSIPRGALTLLEPRKNDDGGKTPTIPELAGPPKSVARARWQTPLECSLPECARSAGWTGQMLRWRLDNGAWTPDNDSNYGPLQRIWRPVPFWNAEWGGYAGTRRPDSSLALQMDAALAEAAASGTVRPLTVLDGGALERQGMFNWSSHPLARQLAGPGELFRDPRGFDFCARWVRYCVARYAHSKAVSQLVLTADLNCPYAPEFHERIGGLLREWNVCFALPMYSLHPLARPARVVKDIGSFERDRGNRLLYNLWHVDYRMGNAVGSVLDRAGLNGSYGYEIRAAKPSVTSIAVSCAYKLEASDWRRPADDNFNDCDALMFEAWVPPDAPKDLRIGVHLRDRDGEWFQTLLPGLLRPGDWNSFALDLTAANAHGLAPVNAERVWSGYSRQRITEIGLHVYSIHPNFMVRGLPSALNARFDNIRGVTFAAPPPATMPQMALYDPQSQKNAPLEKLPHAFERGALVEFHLTAGKVFANPFDVRDCDMVAVITAPSGRISRVPMFFNQLCKRREETPGGNEIVEAYGPEFFTMRFRAAENGPHALVFELREGGSYKVARMVEDDERFTPDGQSQTAQRARYGSTTYPRTYPDGKRYVDNLSYQPGKLTAKLELGAQAFTVTPGARPFHGFLHVAADKRHFEFDDGTFFYPIGPCLRSPSDTRVPYADDKKFNTVEIGRLGRRGTYQFDEYLEAFGKNGVNWARMWMCSWWGGLEWRRDWPGYQGLGRYNLLNAWRVDHVLALAEEKGVHMNVAVTNHGQFTLNIDTEWKDNPYNGLLGGMMNGPLEIFTLGDAKIAHRNKLRYTVARYGHSPSVMAFALFSELEFTEEYDRSHKFDAEQDLPCPHMAAWHSEMAAYIHEVDPNRHMVTTHFSHPARGEDVLAVPEIDFATSNAYSMFSELANGRGDAGAALQDFWAGNGGSLRGFHIFAKPALVEEQGRHWMGMDGGGREHNTKAQLDADLHAGVWGSVVQPLSGATGYWWWLHVHLDGRYGDYRALSKFVENEDFRPAPGEQPMQPVARDINDTPLRGRAMKSDRRVYAWVYHEDTPFGREGILPVAGAKMNVGGLIPGKYTLEFWNTYTGERISATTETIPASGKLSIALPTVERDVALKLKPVAGATRPPLTPTAPPPAITPPPAAPSTAPAVSAPPVPPELAKPNEPKPPATPAVPAPLAK